MIMPKNNAQPTPSITEWMKKINYPMINQFRREDSTRRDRLEIMNKMFGLPYLQAEKLPGQAALTGPEIIKKIIDKMGNKTCLFKLLPLKPGKPKLRIRGKSIQASFNWLLSQKIDPTKYKIEIVPIENARFSAVFCVSGDKAWGEVAEGPIWNFSRGYHKKPSVIFSYDFARWQFSSKNPPAEKFIKKSLSFLRIRKAGDRKKIQKRLKAEVNKSGYLTGYFECEERARGIMFIDYNRILYGMLRKSRVSIATKARSIKGICVGPGKTEGIIKVIKNPRCDQFAKGSVLVCKTANFSHLPLIKKSSGIITENNAVLSHMTIICRELKKPFMTRVSMATQQLKNGDKIFLDADNGLAYVIK